jgi:hypothetical protein
MHSNHKYITHMCIDAKENTSRGGVFFSTKTRVFSDLF